MLQELLADMHLDEEGERVVGHSGRWGHGGRHVSHRPAGCQIRRWDGTLNLGTLQHM